MRQRFEPLPLLFSDGQGLFGSAGTHLRSPRIIDATTPDLVYLFLGQETSGGRDLSRARLQPRSALVHRLDRVIPLTRLDLVVLVRRPDLDLAEAAVFL